MSIAEFSKALKAQAGKAVLDRLAKSSTIAYKSRSANLSAASLLEEDRDKLRQLGKKQGLTRLVVTEDSLSELLSSFGIIYGSPGEAVQLYLQYLAEKVPGYKNKHFEFYDEEGNLISSPNRNTPLGDYIPTLKSGIIAVRGLNFSHDNTLTHMTKFLQYAGAGSLTGLSEVDAKKAVSEVFERGHILATTTGRQIASIGGIQAEKDALDKIVQLSIDLDIASSSLSKPKYAKILSSINKDFTDKRMFMNIEFQAVRNETGTGNQDSADITRGLRAISTLRKLIDNVSITSRGALVSNPVAVNAQIAAKVMSDLVDKIAKYENQIIKVLGTYVENAPKYVVDLKSSKSAVDHVVDSVIATMKGIKTEKVKVAHTKVKVTEVSAKKSSATNLTSKVKPLVAARKKELNNLLKVAGKIKKPEATISITNLEALLRARLYSQVKQNMGTGTAKNVLNYRTGRFAKSANIDRVLVSRQGMVSVFYNYMRNPYGTFSEGGKQQYPRSRDPKLLISKSIREIGASLVGNRLRAILV